MTAVEIIERCMALHDRGIKPPLPQVRMLIDAYYALPGNGCGGELHVVLDDGNYERDSIRFCIASAARVESRWLGHVLLMLSGSQRRKM